MVVDHPVSFSDFSRVWLIYPQILGKDCHLASFLEKSEAPVRPLKLKKGWLSGVKDKWEARNYSVKDCDEWFGKERDWALAYNTNIKWDTVHNESGEPFILIAFRTYISS